MDDVVSLQESAGVLLRQNSNEKNDVDIRKQETITLEAAAKIIKRD